MSMYLLMIPNYCLCGVTKIVMMWTWVESLVAIPLERGFNHTSLYAQKGGILCFSLLCFARSPSSVTIKVYMWYFGWLCWIMMWAVGTISLGVLCTLSCYRWTDCFSLLITRPGTLEGSPFKRKSSSIKHYSWASILCALWLYNRVI